MTIILNPDFALCVGDMEANTVSETDNVGDGMFVLCGYCVTGGGVITHGDGSFQVESDKYYNISHLHGKKLILNNSNNFSRWISVNPIPENKVLIPTFYQGPLNITLSTSTNERKIVVVEGTAIINDKTLNELSIGKVSANKTISLSLLDRCAVIVLEKV